MTNGFNDLDGTIDTTIASFMGELPAAVKTAPGMLTESELRLLYALSSRVYTGQGAVVDGGSFFGSSATALAAGLRSRADIEDITGRLGQPITAYELGYLPAPKNGKETWRVYGDRHYRFGDSFVPILEEVIQPYRDLIELRIGDFHEESWESDRPIELCFVDFAKTSQLNAYATAQLFPALIPGGYLLHQDFYFDRLPWIKVTMEYLSQWFDWVGQVASTAVFRCKQQIPADVCAFDPYTQLPMERKLELHDQALEHRLPEKRRFMLEISGCYLMALGGDQHGALAKLDQVQERYPDQVVPDWPRGVNRLERARRQIQLNRMKMS